MLKSSASRLVAFVLLAALAIPGAGVVVGMVGVAGPTAAQWYGAALTVALLGATLFCSRLSGERLADLGFRARRGDLVAALVAFVTGASLFVAALLVLGWMGGGAWERSATSPLRAAVVGLLPVLCLMASEELLFRGYAFQQLRRLYGSPSAVLLSAVLFGAYHLLGSGDWAMGALFRWLMPTAGGVVFGLLLLKTGSIAVPLGLHWGGNWAQAALLGLGAQPEHSRAVWVMPLSPVQVHDLAAPELLPHLPYLGVLALSLVLVWAIPDREQPAT